MSDSSFCVGFRESDFGFQNSGFGFAFSVSCFGSRFQGLGVTPAAVDAAAAVSLLWGVLVSTLGVRLDNQGFRV